jgi:UDP-N-acetyl-D-mannosaminuronate dehydrogenase
MQPGFGVGGFCLTKDPLFAKIGAHRLFDRQDLSFPFCEHAVEVNETMPMASIKYLDNMLGGLEGKRIALFGVSYRQDVGDTRFSPAETFFRNAVKRGAIIKPHDPLIQKWEELELNLDPLPPVASTIDAAIFAVRHQEYRDMDVVAWASGAKPAVLDANNVLSPKQREQFRSMGCKVQSVGVGG